MRIKLILVMEDLFVPEIYEGIINHFSIEWEQDINQEELLELSHKWISSKCFLSKRMIGLQKVGPSSLTIESIDDLPNIHIL